jgi:TetR/AcrR family transcriptional regulator, repressor for uid operon
MNVHSQRGDMVAPTLLSARKSPDAERRERILEAAERAFVAHGFHAATMSHVADEAGMSAGNLYRTFPSKESIIEALCAIDQEGSAEAFAALLAPDRDFAEAIRTGLRDHVLMKPREKARMIVEIWAEAGRNARVAEFTRAIDADVISNLEQVIERAKASGFASPAVDTRFAARFFVTFVAGIFKRIATEPDFDRDAETAMAYGVLKALFAGSFVPFRTETLR